MKKGSVQSFSHICFFLVRKVVVVVVAFALACSYQSQGQGYAMATISASLFICRYRLVPHFVAATCRSRAATSISAEWPSGNAPTTPPIFGWDVGAQANANINGPCHILQPTADEMHILSAENSTATEPILFQAVGQPQISWNVSAQYATSKNKGSSAKTQTFVSSNNTPISQQFQSMGGQITAVATCTLPNNRDDITIKFSGSAVSQSAAIDRLASLYGSGYPTPRLMTGISYVESRLRQFAPRTLYGVSALWPLESYDGGSHIGLMQVGTTMDDAFNWLTNTSDGVALFLQKVSAAKRISARIQSTHQGLPALTGVQLENMGLLLYGPYAKSSLDMQYYVPSCVGGTVSGNVCHGGSWEWIVNTAGNPNGVDYADHDRNSVQ
jgi:hypothetical protein